MIFRCAAFAALLLSGPLFAQECPPDTPLGFALLAPGAAEEGERNVLDVFFLPDAEVSIEVTAYLENHTGQEEVTVRACALFAMSVEHDASLLKLEEVTTDGTDYRENRGFHVAFIAPNDDRAGFVAGDPSCFVNSHTVTFGRRLSLVRARYSLAAPHPVERSGETIVARIRFVDELRPCRGCVPVSNGTSWLGSPFAPCLRDFEVRFHVREASDFIRADANFDQHIDISDPITVLRTLFFGDARIRCSDGADANDDGAVDISDAIYGLYYLFRGGPPPSAPFPEAGSDPTPDGLHCIEHL